MFYLSEGAEEIKEKDLGCTEHQFYWFKGKAYRVRERYSSGLNASLVRSIQLCDRQRGNLRVLFLRSTYSGNNRGTNNRARLIYENLTRSSIISGNLYRLFIV